MMQAIFGKILEMSLIGGWCILLVLPIRLLLLRCGRKYAYYLWLAVFLRLLLPFGIQGSFSLIPRQVMEISDRTESEAKAPGAENVLAAYGNGHLEYMGDMYLASENTGLIRKPEFSGISRESDPYQTRGRLREISQLVWLSGIFIIAAFNLFHVLMLKRQTARDRWTAYDRKERIAEIEGLQAPFLWGIWHPVIFLPAGLLGEERRYIVAHESFHRRRRDSIMKAVCFAVTAIHWFNPVVWIAWMLFCRDMEVSCDEAVVAEARTDIKRQYAATLLKYAAAQNGYLMAPLTFGEPSVKSRIKNILRFQKKNVILTGAAGLAAALVALGLIITPSSAEEPQNENPSVYTLPEAENQEKESDKPDTDKEKPESAVSEEKPVDVEEKTEEETEQTSIGAYEASMPERVPYDNSAFDALPHREGYVEASVKCVAEESIYFSPSLRSEEELDALAQRALRELYDLTGFQVKECVYECTDLGSFHFGKTEENLRHSMNFYTRSFGEAEGYNELVIPSMYIVSARRVWYSDVQQLDLPFNIEQMDEGEQAVWFLQHSTLYEGGEIAGVELSDIAGDVTVRMADGSFYEITLDMGINAVSHIYGPYPEGSTH